ncbi:MAG: PTS sugar transporter subunit IIA [Thermodesulfobacteriota bacterium]
MEAFFNILGFAASFAVIALASKQIGHYLLRTSLPLITGFLLTGILAGPHGLNLISAHAVAGLRFVDEISLAFIAFAAGNEIYIKDMKSRLKSIQWVTAGLTVATLAVCGTVIFCLTGLIPGMGALPLPARISVGVMGASILVALSPSATLAVINEVRASGPFTQTVLGVTMIVDVVVIALFAVSLSVTGSLLTGMGMNIGFIGILLLELGLSLFLGYMLGILFMRILQLAAHQAVKAALILLSGYGVYALSHAVRDLSHANLPFEILMEPLLICMIGGFVVTNFCRCRMDFSNILQSLGPPVYIAFFTLTGASLPLDVLTRTWPVALLLVMARFSAVVIGATTAGMAAREPAEYNRIGWMAYITQAGVSLGLAKALVVEFPEWGGPFAAILIAVVVFNQLFGPPLLKLAIAAVKESHPRGDAPVHAGPREAVIFGLEPQSLALARLLISSGWQVRITVLGGVADTSQNMGVKICHIPGLTLNALEQMDAGRAEAIVTLLSDEENLRICELAYEHFGTPNLVVRINDRSVIDRFRALGALIVDPGTALVHLLDQFVRSPSAASLLLGMEENQSVVEMEVRNPNLHGMALRDLRLPISTLILSIRRRGQVLVSHGYTRLEVGDMVTLVGTPESLKEVELRFDVNREHALAHLVEKVTPRSLASESLSTEVRKIIQRGEPGHDQPETQAPDRFDRFVEESMVLDLDRRVNVEELFQQIADMLSVRLKISQDTLYGLLMEREKESSTAINQGLAIPHIVIEGTRTFALLLARCRQGIRFSESAPMVQAVFVLAGTRDERNFHLQALAAIAQIVQNPGFEKQWLRARDDQALRDVVLRANRKRMA